MRLLVACLAFLAAAPVALGRGPTVWTLPTVAPEGSPSAETVAYIASSIETAAGGRLRVRARNGGVVGDEIGSLELCQRGGVQVWAGSVGAIAAKIPALSVLETPYLFDDVKDFNRATQADILHSPQILKAFHDQGLEPFGTAFLGWRDISSQNRAIRLPADLRGLKARAQPAPLHRAMWRLLGALPRETALNAVMAAFVEREVEVSDLPALYVYATSIAPRIKYYTRTNHMVQAGIVVFNRAAFERLPRRVQAGIAALRKDVASHTAQLHADFENELVELLRKQGVTVLSLGSEERAQWKRAMAPLRAEAERISGPAGTELLRALAVRG